MARCESGRPHVLRWVIPGLGIAALLLLATPHGGGVPAPTYLDVRGVVRGADGPVAGALVRVQTTESATRTSAGGRFALRVPLSVRERGLTAWAPGHYCEGPYPVPRDGAPVSIRLRPHATRDHPEYAWVSSTHSADEDAETACVACHSREGTDLEFPLPVDEWRLDAHAGSARNPRFLTMYLGTDIQGRSGPPTRFVTQPDYGRMPIPPDPALPDRGPGYRLDHPDSAGTCAACHAPAAAFDAPYDTDPSTVTGVGAEGHPCDLCHKVWDVVLDATTGLPHENAHGVLSMELRRPPPGQQLFLGPLDDVAPGDDACSPLQRESSFCAPCHHARFWGTVVYDSFGEWLRSRFSHAETGRTCQDCHMPRLEGATHFARPDRGGLARPLVSIASHRMPGAADPALLREALDLEVDAERSDGEVVVRVMVENRKTGHHVPTGSPLRHVILLVRASRSDGTPLVQRAGPTVPSWCGEGDPAKGRYAGLPGTAFAKVLESLWSGDHPTAAYWNPTRVRSDNRIAAGASDVSRYRFDASDEGRIDVEVQILFRRAFVELAAKKGWTDPDLLMARQMVRVPPDE